MLSNYTETKFLTFWRLLDLARAMGEKPAPTLGEAWGIYTVNGKADGMNENLRRLAIKAQQEANVSGSTMVILNLNRVGSPIYVIREATEQRLKDAVAGPFEPQEVKDNG